MIVEMIDSVYSSSELELKIDLMKLLINTILLYHVHDNLIDTTLSVSMILVCYL